MLNLVFSRKFIVKRGSSTQFPSFLTICALLITIFFIPTNAKTLVFYDEFDNPAGSRPDPAKWTFEIGGGGWGNRELEYYTSQNAQMDGEGSLVVTAIKIAPSSGLTCWYGPCQYTSGRLTTKRKFDLKFGRFEARIRIPRGQGVWPAFWLLGNDIGTIGWPKCGEIDIMENIGREPSTVHGTIHGPGYSGSKGIGAPFKLADNKIFADDFHLYAVEWTAGELRWYVDGVKYQTVKPQNLPAGTRWVFDHPFFIILNLAIGGEWPGSPDNTIVFPQTMLVDYVRVYKK
jgi:beta-glucanase (GH16 family)